MPGPKRWRGRSGRGAAPHAGAGAASRGAAGLAVLALASLGGADLRRQQRARTNPPPCRRRSLRRAAGANRQRDHRVLKRHWRAPTRRTARDRVELLGVGFEWANAGHGPRLRPHARLQPAAARISRSRRHGRRHRLARRTSASSAALFPSYHCRWPTCWACATSPPGAPIDQRRPRAACRATSTLVARTADAYVYENPRALPRVHVRRRLAARRFREHEGKRAAGRSSIRGRPCCSTWSRRRRRRTGPAAAQGE